MTNKIKDSVTESNNVFPNGLPFLKPFLPSFESLEEKIKNILSSGMLTKGKINDEYEKKVSSFLGVDHVIATSSATTGLMLTLLALDIKGDVLVPSFTFCATANAIVRAGANPVFVDCDPDSYTICLEDIERKITPNTQAIMAVHVFGIPAKCKELKAIADKHNLKLIFDSAHAFGSELESKKIGGFGDVEVFSTTPTKTLVTGEGGIISTNNKELADKIRVLKEYGNAGDYNNPYAGLNGRLSEMQCALGIGSLEILKERIAKKEKIVEAYSKMLVGVPGLGFQSIPNNVKTTYKDFSITVDAEKFGCSRDNLESLLAAKGIPTRKYFYPALHQMLAFVKYHDESIKLPVTEKLSGNILCLPLYPDLAIDDAIKIALAILDIHTSLKGGV